MRIAIVSTLLLGTLTFHAQAFDFAISNFQVSRNGSTIFDDTFATSTPPKAPNFSGGTTASYTLPAGSFSPAVNGKLRLNSAAATISPVVSARLAVSAHLNTDLNAADGTKGLKPGSAFRVVGTWDAIAPEGTEEKYLIELSDWANKACDACIRLGVTKNTDGTVEVQFWTNKIGSDQILDKTVLGKATFAPGANQQIRLTLKKDSPTTNEVRASYAYVNNGAAGQEIELPGSANIFTARGYAIAAFKATAPAAYGKPTGTNKDLTLTANINVDNGHAGKTGNIYVVAIYQGSIFAHNGTSWAAWSGTTTLPAYASNVSLTDRSINVLDKLDVSSIVGTTILVGYASSYEDLIATQAYDVVHTVQ